MELRMKSPEPEEVIVYNFISKAGLKHQIDLFEKQGDTVEPVIVNGEVISLVFHFPRLNLSETINARDIWRSSIERQRRLYLDPKAMKEQLMEFARNEQAKRTGETRETLPPTKTDASSEREG